MFITPFERILKQQNNCKENIEGYAVAICSYSTVRACYLTEACEFTNYEKDACIKDKKEAIESMLRLYRSKNVIIKHTFKYALLVPVSKELPLTEVTFNGF